MPYVASTSLLNIRDMAGRRASLKPRDSFRGSVLLPHGESAGATNTLDGGQLTEEAPGGLPAAQAQTPTPTRSQMQESNGFRVGCSHYKGAARPSDHIARVRDSPEGGPPDSSAIRGRAAEGGQEARQQEQAGPVEAGQIVRAAPGGSGRQGKQPEHHVLLAHATADSPFYLPRQRFLDRSL